MHRALFAPLTLSPGWLKIDPNFDPLRKNPRFQKLVATDQRGGRGSRGGEKKP